MSFKADVLRVMIASPSDVSKERNEIEKTIFEWNSLYAENMEIVLLPGRWENDVAPSFNGIEAQQVINEQLVNICDLVIGVFWTRLGTPTLKHSSGTLEEINLFLDQGKEVMIYFVESHIPNDCDFDEIKKVAMFKSDYGKKGVYATYDINSISKHLYRKVIDYKRKRERVEELNHPNPTNLINSIDSKLEAKNHLEGLIQNGKLTDKEKLLLSYILETGDRNLGVRWKAEETIGKIKKWELENILESMLSNSYDQIVHNIAERGLLVEKEFTDHGNVRLYSMPIEVYDDLRSLSENSIKNLQSVVDSLILF